MPVGIPGVLVNPVSASTSTIDASSFAGATNEAKITAAVAYAVANNVRYVWVPKSMYPYNASLVTFNPVVTMLREGGRPDCWDLQAYGATATVDDSAAFAAAFAGAEEYTAYFGTTLVGAPRVVVPTRKSAFEETFSYNIVTSQAVPAGIILEGDGMHAAMIRFMPSPTNKTMFYSHGTAEAQSPTAILRNLFLYNGVDAGENIAVRVRNHDALTFDHVVVTNFRVGVWTDWAQNVLFDSCEITLNIRGLMIGGDVAQTETPVPPAGIRGGAFAPNFMDSVTIRRSSFAQNECDIDYCGSQYALGGLEIQNCRFYESTASPVPGKFVFIRLSGSQGVKIRRCEFESPHARAGVSLNNTGLDSDANGPNYGVDIDTNTFLFTTASASSQPVVVSRGTAIIHGNTFICATGGTPAQPITLSDNTSPSVVGPNTYMTFVNGAVPTEGYANPVTITAEPNGGHIVQPGGGGSPNQVTFLSGAAADVTPDAPRCWYGKIRVTTNGAFTVNNPTNPHCGFDLTLHFENASGGAMATPTMGSEYRLSGAIAMPANGQVRIYQFRREKLDGTAKWREVYRSPADQPV